MKTSQTVFEPSRFRGGWFVIGLVATAVMILAPAATAAPVNCLPPAGAALAPGAFVIPGDCTGAPAGTLLATLSVPFTSTLGLDSGTLVSAVFREAGGTLDFYYQVNLNATSTNCPSANHPACDPLARETDTDFTGFATAVATRLDGATLPGAVFVDGTAIPVSADRSASGDVVGFSFTPPCCSFEIQPGQSSVVLVIATDATNFTAGNASVIDGGTTTVAAFEPASAVPEPNIVILLGVFVVGLGVVRHRRIKHAA